MRKKKKYAKPIMQQSSSSSNSNLNSQATGSLGAGSANIQSPEEPKVGQNAIPFHTHVMPLPPSAKKSLLPYMVVKMLTGAKAIPNYQGCEDVTGLFWNNEYDVLHNKDFSFAQQVAQVVWEQQVEGKNLLAALHSVPVLLEIHRAAQDYITHFTDQKYAGKKGILFIKDQTGCGYWRIVVPSRYLTRTDIYTECMEEKVAYDFLLEFDTIMVQRLHTWSEYYIIERLKKLGKRIVYDVDDDIFNIPPGNSAFRIIGPDAQEAARAIMGLVDVITTPSEVIKERFGFVDKTMVIPNCIDLDDGWPVVDDNDEETLKRISSPDGFKRIFWQGSATHSEDWMACAEALDKILERHDDVKLVLMGYLPPIVQSFINDESRPWWDGHVEYGHFNAIETYLWTVKHIRAEVALAPLEKSTFTQAKCVDTTMRVATNVGIVEAGEIKAGMKVWRDGWKKVEETRTEAQREGLEIETKMGYLLRLSPEHRMLVDGKWTRADDIAVGSTIAMSREKIATLKFAKAPWPSDSRMNKAGRPNSDGTTRRSTSDPYSFLRSADAPKIDITPRWGRIFGAYVGDGSVGQATALQILCDGQDQDWIDILIDDFREVGLNPRTELITTFSGEVLRRRAVKVSSAHLIRVLEGLGLAKMRENGNPIRVVRVPEVIWNSPKSVIAEFLAAYFEADGCTTHCGVSAVSKDKKFLLDIQRLLVAFGIISRVSSRTYKCQTCKGTDWHLTMRRDAADVFEKEIGFRSKRKSTRLSDITSKKHSNSFRPMEWNDEVMFVRPCTITPVDIQVEEGEFVLAGFVSHNSCLKFVENTAIGAPTVASNVMPYAGVIENNVDGFLVDSPQAWEDTIERLLTRPDERLRVLRAARKKVEDRFNIKKEISQWEKAFGLETLPSV